MATKGFQLTELVDKGVLEEIVDHFQKATGLATMITDYQGRPIVLSGKLSVFCEAIRKRPDCHDSCSKCDAMAGMEASYIGKPLIYLCHAGVVDIASPILLNGNYIGTIMIGQVALSEEEARTLPRRTVYPGIDFSQNPDIEKLREDSIKSFPVMTLKQLQAYCDLLFIISNHIAGIGYKKLLEQKLHEQSLKSVDEEREKALLSQELTRHQLRAVQAQLKPAFLLNTFNSIQRQALLEDATLTAELLVSFSSIFRRMLKTNESFATLSDELNYIDKYLSLGNISARKKVTFTHRVPDDILKFEIPIFTLQPFVEIILLNDPDDNPIDCNICLNASKENEHICLDISCKQAMLSHETLEGLKNCDKDHGKSDSITVRGAKNVIRVLKEYYGDGFTWICTSSPNSGTTIRLLIPVESR